jgi:two-component system sensor histidine kinase VicK
MTLGTRRLNKDQLLNILALSKDATAVYTGEDLIIEMANDAMIGFWGKDRSVIGRSFIEAVPELVGQPFFGLLQDVWRSGITYQATDTAARLRVGGELQWSYYDFEYRAIKDAEGKVYGILHTATDVTERHFNRQQLQDGAEREQQLNEELTVTNEELASANEELVTNMEDLAGVNDTLLRTQQELLQLTDELERRVAGRVAELSESEDRFRNMAESSDVLIAVADESSKGIYFNKAWVELTGKSEQELLEFGWADLIHPDDKQRWLDTYLAAAERQVPVNGEFRIRSKNGDYHW